MISTFLSFWERKCEGNIENTVRTFAYILCFIKVNYRTSLTEGSRVNRYVCLLDPASPQWHYYSRLTIGNTGNMIVALNFPT